jgi:plasmid stabilization system protein ParE
MAKEIKWTSEAEDTFENILVYLQSNWTAKEIAKFIRATDRTILYISESPLMFRQSKKKNIREAVITKHNLLLYRIKSRQIELLVFWDTRKNPKKKLKPKK